jgi:hypothetical protein
LRGIYVLSVARRRRRRREEEGGLGFTHTRAHSK